MTTRPRFAPGRNIAMKVPAHEFEATVGFYRDTLGLTLLDEGPDDAGEIVTTAPER